MKYNKKILPWLCWGISSCFVLFQFLLQTSTSVMIKDLEQAFSVGVLEVSLLSSSFFYTYLLLQIPCGILVDRYGARVTLIGSLFLMTAACVVFAKSNSLPVAVASRIFLGMASAPAAVCAFYLAAYWFHGRYFALLAGLVEMLGMLGGVAGESLMARAVAVWGWRTTFLGCGSLAFLMMLLAGWVVRDSSNGEKKIAHQTFRQSGKNLLAILRLPQAWINGLFCGLSFAVLAAFAGFWSVPYLMQRYHSTVSLAADASSIIFIGAALGAPFWGWFSDRLARRRPLVVVVTMAMLLLMLVILYVSAVPISLMFFLLFTLGFCSGIYVLPFAIMRDLTPAEMRGTAMGYTNMMCILLGSPLLQPLIGWLLSREAGHQYTLIEYQQALVLLPLCLMAALVLGFFIKDPGFLHVKN